MLNRKNTVLVRSYVVVICLAFCLPGAEPSLIPGSPFNISTSYVDDGKTKMEITVSSSNGGFIAVGLSEDGTMNSGGKGSDVVVCDKSGVKRYWVTAYASPENGVTVPGSTCTQKGQVSKLVFIRNILAIGKNEISILPGKKQNLIWATKDSSFELAYHGEDKGTCKFDFGENAVLPNDNVTRSPTVWLWMHAGFMIMAWGVALPWGVSFANRLRALGGTKKTDSWFVLHKRCQVVGWGLQLCGFGAAFAHCQLHSKHFFHPHAVFGLVLTAVCTLQPLNAFIRPHASPETKKSTSRMLWEIMHKGLGWMAVVGGLVNLVLGGLLAHKLSYASDFWVTAVAIGGGASGFVALYFIASLLVPENPCSRSFESLVTHDNVETNEKQMNYVPVPL